MPTGNVIRIFLHFNWATKYREPVITAEMEKIIRDVAIDKAGEYGFYVIAVDGTEDHRHLLVGCPATLTAADIMKYVKGGSSFMINELGFPKAAGKRFRWQGGYAVYSVSHWMVERIKKYIENQKVHHRKKRLIFELEVQEEDFETDDPEE